MNNCGKNPPVSDFELFKTCCENFFAFLPIYYIGHFSLKIKKQNRTRTIQRARI